MTKRRSADCSVGVKADTMRQNRRMCQSAAMNPPCNTQEVPIDESALWSRSPQRSCHDLRDYCLCGGQPTSRIEVLVHEGMSVSSPRTVYWVCARMSSTSMPEGDPLMRICSSGSLNICTTMPIINVKPQLTNSSVDARF